MVTANEGDVRAVLSAAERYHAALSVSGFDLSTAYLLLVSAVESLAGHYYKDLPFDFDTAEHLKWARSLISELKDGEVDEDKIDVVRRVILEQNFVWKKLYKFITEFLPDRFWDKEGAHPDGYGLPTISPSDLKKFLAEVYSRRSKLAHQGMPFPSYVAFGAREQISRAALMQAIELQRSGKKFVPPFAWFERLTHCVVDEFLAHVIAPDVGNRRVGRSKAAKELLQKIAELPPNARASLENLTRWTAQFLGMTVIGPMAPNKIWATDAEAIEILTSQGFISGDDRTEAGSASLKDRLVGEAAGETFWGRPNNPFRGNDILEPPNLG